MKQKKRHLKAIEAVVLGVVLIVTFPTPGWVVVVAALLPRAKRAFKETHRSYRALKRVGKSRQTVRKV